MSEYLSTQELLQRYQNAERRSYSSFMNFLTVTATVGAAVQTVQARHAGARDFSNYRFWRPYELPGKDEDKDFLRQR